MSGLEGSRRAVGIVGWEVADLARAGGETSGLFTAVILTGREQCSCHGGANLQCSSLKPFDVREWQDAHSIVYKFNEHSHELLKDTLEGVLLRDLRRCHARSQAWDAERRVLLR